jgi:hypothetical protein
MRVGVRHSAAARSSQFHVPRAALTEFARSEHQREHGGEGQDRRNPADHYDRVLHRSAHEGAGSALASFVTALAVGSGRCSTRRIVRAESKEA